MSIIPNDYDKGVNKTAKLFRNEIEVLKKENEDLKEQLRLYIVSDSKPSRFEKNNLPIDIRYLFNKGVGLYKTIENYERGFMTKEEFIVKMREVEKAYCG